MMPKVQHEAWVRGMMAKRAESALRVLSHLIEAGLYKGQCSAEDIPDSVRVSHPNVIGGVFKLLPNCGFYKDRAQFIKMSAPRKNGREVPIWVLQHRWMAEYVKDAMAGVLPVEEIEKNQLMLMF